MAALSAGTLSIIATANDSDNNDNASGLHPVIFFYLIAQIG
jgi:hypothetical protein